jgi:hypothetical protein
LSIVCYSIGLFEVFNMPSTSHIIAISGGNFP